MADATMYPFASRTKALAAVLAGLTSAVPICAQQQDASIGKPKEQVVITAKPLMENSSDEEVTKRVKEALDSDPWVYAEHVTVTTKDGVVTLEGLIGDEWDLRLALRISNRLPGVKRVVDNLELLDQRGDLMEGK